MSQKAAARAGARARARARGWAGPGPGVYQRAVGDTRWLACGLAGMRVNWRLCCPAPPPPFPAASRLCLSRWAHAITTAGSTSSTCRDDLVSRSTAAAQEMCTRPNPSSHPNPNSSTRNLKLTLRVARIKGLLEIEHSAKLHPTIHSHSAGLNPNTRIMHPAFPT